MSTYPRHNYCYYPPQATNMVYFNRNIATYGYSPKQVLSGYDVNGNTTKVSNANKRQRLLMQDYIMQVPINDSADINYAKTMILQKLILEKINHEGYEKDCKNHKALILIIINLSIEL
ncbi:hypothetical protein TKK_0014028 [Trichogramma kaykai]